MVIALLLNAMLCFSYYFLCPFLLLYFFSFRKQPLFPLEVELRLTYTLSSPDYIGFVVVVVTVIVTPKPLGFAIYTHYLQINCEPQLFPTWNREDNPFEDIGGKAYGGWKRGSEGAEFFGFS